MFGSLRRSLINAPRTFVVHAASEMSLRVGRLGLQLDFFHFRKTRRMLSVADALARIIETVKPLPISSLPILQTLGRVLAADILADLDSPPFDKALMDGFAVSAADLQTSASELTVIEEVTAGRVPQRLVGTGQATRIMTGAMIPTGADAVVKIEDCELVGANGERVVIRTNQIRPEQNILRRGMSMRAGQRVMPAGRLLRAQELAALAEMGQASVSVRPKPRIAVLATGDELVPIEQTPGPGQIRNSNETMLVAQIVQAGGEAVPLGVARDERSHLREKIAAGLDCDLLLLSGGVSAGKLDLVPSELEHAGVEQIFHKINMKPGKPLWFGMLKRAARPCFVFGLPGNPVSSMVCFELFVRTAIRKITGESRLFPEPQMARLTHPHHHKDDRETYFPAALGTENGSLVVRLMNWHGSSDLQSTVEANAMAVFPPLPGDYAAGAMVPVVSW